MIDEGDTVETMGTDIWPYWLDSDRPALQATRYSYEQGLVERRLEVEEMYAPGLWRTGSVLG